MKKLFKREFVMVLDKFIKVISHNNKKQKQKKKGSQEETLFLFPVDTVISACNSGNGYSQAATNLRINISRGTVERGEESGCLTLMSLNF